MTKKHFIALADALMEISRRLEFCSNSDGLIITTDAKRIVTDELVRFCRAQNGRFKTETFIGYSRGECGPSGGTIRKAKS